MEGVGRGMEKGGEERERGGGGIRKKFSDLR